MLDASALGDLALRNPDITGFRVQGSSENMAEVKVFYDKAGNTLTVWFADPSEEHICEETGEEVVLMKDKTGRVVR